MEVYLVRHTTPKLTAGLIYGHLDVALTDNFQNEIDTVLTKLPVHFDRVYSSPSSRCVQLVKEITTSFVTDERLMELNFGDWEGKTWDTVDQQDLQFWMDDFVNVRIPGGESMMDMQQRITEFLEELKLLPYKSVLIVTHGGVIRLLCAKDMGIPPERLFEVKVRYGEVFKMQI